MTATNPQDEAARVGYFGTEGDATPDEHYTIDGVTAGRPAPETTRAHHERVPQPAEVDPANLNAEFTAQETTNV